MRLGVDPQLCGPGEFVQLQVVGSVGSGDGFRAGWTEIAFRRSELAVELVLLDRTQGPRFETAGSVDHTDAGNRSAEDVQDDSSDLRAAGNRGCLGGPACREAGILPDPRVSAPRGPRLRRRRVDPVRGPVASMGRELPAASFRSSRPRPATLPRRVPCGVLGGAEEPAVPRVSRGRRAVRGPTTREAPSAWRPRSLGVCAAPATDGCSPSWSAHPVARRSAGAEAVRSTGAEWSSGRALPGLARPRPSRRELRGAVVPKRDRRLRSGPLDVRVGFDGRRRAESGSDRDEGPFAASRGSVDHASVASAGRPARSVAPGRRPGRGPRRAVRPHRESTPHAREALRCSSSRDPTRRRPLPLCTEEAEAYIGSQALSSSGDSLPAGTAGRGFPHFEDCEHRKSRATSLVRSRT